MKKHLIILSLIAVCVVGGFYIFMKNDSAQSSKDSYASGYLTGEYFIDGETISLSDGYFEKEIAPDSASKTVVQYFGNEAIGDISGDGVSDVVFLLTRVDGGSGTFYYAVAAVRTGDTYKGTNAVLLGDRIAPQSTEISNGVASINYAIRKDSDPLSEQPSLGVTLRLSIIDSVLSVVK